jgi:hypothetical protein
MLPGFNHNVRYKGLVFHVQTEDGGLSAPLVTTQLFIGGRLVAIERSSYAELLAATPPDARRAAVLERMQAQHKALLKQLVAGAFDAKLGLRDAGAHPAPTPHPMLAVAADLVLSAPAARPIPPPPSPLPAAPQPAPSPAPELAFLSVLDQEVQRHARAGVEHELVPLDLAPDLDPTAPTPLPPRMELPVPAVPERRPLLALGVTGEVPAAPADPLAPGAARAPERPPNAWQRPETGAASANLSPPRSATSRAAQPTSRPKAPLPGVAAAPAGAAPASAIAADPRAALFRARPAPPEQTLVDPGPPAAMSSAPARAPHSGLSRAAAPRKKPPREASLDEVILGYLSDDPE